MGFMASAEKVYLKYLNHVKNSVNSSPHMKPKKTGGKVTKLTSLYVFGETGGKTECYIDAHGGSYSADYVLDTVTFKVPKGTTVKFFQPAGYCFGAFKSELRNGPPKQHGGTNDQLYNGGDQCPNYMLTKFQGRHSGNDATAVRAQEIDYEGFQDISSDAGIVLVTIRNRWFQPNLTLQSAIKILRGEFKSMTTFNCLFCRVDDTTSGLAQVTWNASSTTGGDWY